MKRSTVMKILPSPELRSSRIGIGFECLDRMMWDDTDAVYQAAGELGVKFARVQSGWERTEKEPGRYDFGWLDRIVDQLQAREIEPFLSLSYGNKLYTPSPAQDSTGCHPLVSEHARRGWENYIAAVAAHFDRRICYYEIWNEPENAMFWYPGPVSPVKYAELVRLTAKLLRKYATEPMIIGGALTHGPTVAGLAALEELLAAGMAKEIDIFSYHHYKTVVEQQRPEHLECIRKMFARHGKATIPIWMGEGGFPSRTGKTQALNSIPTDERIQAEMLLRYMVCDLACGVERSCIFQISDFRNYRCRGLCSEPNHFGVLTMDDPPRKKMACLPLGIIAMLFDLETFPEDCGMVELYSASADEAGERFSFPVDALRCRTALFRRNGKLLLTYHKVCNTIERENCGQIINLEGVAIDNNFSNPRLLDPMTGEVFDELEFRRCGRKFCFHNLPLKPYPLVIAEQERLEELGA